MYFFVEQNGLVVSFGYEEYPGSTYVSEQDLPADWLFTFKACNLGYFDGKLVPFDINIPNVSNEPGQSQGQQFEEPQPFNG